MTETIANELLKVVNSAAHDLRKIDANAAAVKPRAEVWSVKEILGHLVGSAANNHQRFVRAQQADILVSPFYDQDKWIEFQDYEHCSWPELIELWRLYNLQLARIIRRVPESKLGMECKIGTNSPVTLGYVIEDYL